MYSSTYANARNPRQNDAAIDRMVASLEEFGFKIPVLARSDGEVVDGHLRLKAAHKLGYTRRIVFKGHARSSSIN
ncbi:MAG TPA: ParB N-terminal domain-containing protein [Bryobacteraceae bacterium]|jgi:ParB-like chromosome segregation protein Spo0J|nr:ParB N-terminal domain-containing protein [Bryobacteraceae bacterium]